MPLVIFPAAVAAAVLLAVARLAGTEQVEVDPETVKQTTWDLAQQLVVFLVGVATLYGLAIRPVAKKLAAKFEARIAAIAKAQDEANTKLQRVDHQLHPNGGKSAHDYARKAVEGVERLHSMVDEVREATHHNAKRVDRVQGELLAQGWRQQELAMQFSRHESMARESLGHFREALQRQGITLPKAPNEDLEVDL